MAKNTRRHRRQNFHRKFAYWREENERMDEVEKDKVGLALFDRVVGAVERAADALATKWLAEAKAANARAAGFERALELSSTLVPMAVAAVVDKVGGKKDSPS
jgi:hypothetical protein